MKQTIFTKQEAIEKLQALDDNRRVFFYEAPRESVEPSELQGTLFDDIRRTRGHLEQLHVVNPL